MGHRSARMAAPPPPLGDGGLAEAVLRQAAHAELGPRPRLAGLRATSRWHRRALVAAAFLGAAAVPSLRPPAWLGGTWSRRRPGSPWSGVLSRALCGVSRTALMEEADADLVVAEAGKAGWTCIKNCGACCFLKPEDRPYLEDLLSPTEMEMFRGLVGADGWCINYNHKDSSCNIYEDRPSFCRVKTWLASKADGFGFDASDEPTLDTFCAGCCRESIKDVYGATSAVLEAFNAEVPLGKDGPSLEELQDYDLQGEEDEDSQEGWEVVEDFEGMPREGGEEGDQDYEEEEGDAAPAP